MEETTVKDLMVPLREYACIPTDATLLEAVQALNGDRSKHQDGAQLNRAVLVCDKTGRIVGKLSFMDFLKNFRLSCDGQCHWINSAECRRRCMRE